MTRALFTRNLERHRRLLLSMMAGLVVFEVLLIQAGAQIEASAGLRQLVAMLPPAFREMMSTQLGLVSFASVVALGFEHPFTLALAIGFVIVSATIPAAERESGLLDLLLARPVGRTGYFLASVLMVLTCSVLLPSSLLGGVALGLRFVDIPEEIPWTRYAPCAFGLVALMLAVGGGTLLLASGARRRGPPAAQAAGLALALLVVEFLADVWPALGWVRWASPFHYYKPIPAAVFGTDPPSNDLVLLAVFAIGTTLAFVRFHRRDI
jgi:ABC-2 type transport system permease protein